MMMFAIQKHTLSFDLFQRSNECVLSVPGESLAAEALYCGTTSGRDTDKLAECGLAVVGSKTIRVPGLQAAIANLEVEILHRVTTGDHLTVMGLVKRFAVARGNRERNLLSVGPQHDGYLVLLKNGIHRIGVVETETAEPNSAFRAHNKYVALLRKRDSREE
jgi:flavin reductase (DIM6/NTAB) family NADH-FMN oxidoreductase RutF